jgi:hypothetical protein
VTRRSGRRHALGAIAGVAAFAVAAGCARAPRGETVDTLDYLLSDHPETALAGETTEAGKPEAPSHSLSLSVVGNEAYYVKWHPNAYEKYGWDDDSIYLREDRSFTDANDEGRWKPQSFAPGLWMKRRMRVGEVADMGQNQVSLVYRGDCRPGRSTRLGYQTVLEAHDPAFDAGGDLGRQDVIVLRYDYSFRTGIADRARVNRYEKFYYSREWGWIQWELYADEDLHKDPPPLVARYRANRKAPRKLEPNLENTCNRARVVGLSLDGRPLSDVLTLEPGARRVVKVTVQNVGGSRWRSEGDVRFRLGRVGDAPGEGHRLDLRAGESVEAQATTTFAVPVVAPREPGDYEYQWRMLVEGAEWFGDKTRPLLVTVEGTPRGRD